MIRIGIITYFYNSINYGGILQAYALCKFVNKIDGVSAEQICYDYDSYNDKYMKKRIKKKIKRILARFIKKYKTQYLKTKNFRIFVTNYIPHSRKVYSQKNIHMVNKEYDIFIAGSDQIWNPISMDDNFFLQFVNKGKRTLSYAASMGADNIDSNSLLEIIIKLKKFDAISVRETSTKRNLMKNNLINMEVMIDPVFLLDVDEWNSVAEVREKLHEPYIFMYILSDDIYIHNKVLNYAREKHFMIVNLSPLKLIDGVDVISLSEVGPSFFVGYIKNAQYCITDSFHCTAFSIIYKRKFIAFARKSELNVSANNRIRDLLIYIGEKERMVDKEDKFDTVLEKNLSHYEDKMCKVIDIGKKFLMDNILKNCE